jgi:hypothetical protein
MKRSPEVPVRLLEGDYFSDKRIQCRKIRSVHVRRSCERANIAARKVAAVLRKAPDGLRTHVCEKELLGIGG